MNRKSISEHALRILETAETGIGLSQVPKHCAIPRVEFSGLFEIWDRIIPTTLAPIDGARGIPDLGIVGCGLVSNGQFGPGELVVAIAVIVVVSEGKPSIAQIGLK